jgi:hypothetical protein
MGEIIVTTIKSVFRITSIAPDVIRKKIPGANAGINILKTLPGVNSIMN